MALALRDEITDLEEAGIRIIQVDEPALERAAAELPLRQLWVNPDCGLKTRAYPRR